jgi:hypothetical protein
LSWSIAFHRGEAKMKVEAWAKSDDLPVKKGISKMGTDCQLACFPHGAGIDGEDPTV